MTNECALHDHAACGGKAQDQPSHFAQNSQTEGGHGGEEGKAGSGSSA
jgi:hypothetical protein